MTNKAMTPAELSELNAWAVTLMAKTPTLARDTRSTSEQGKANRAAARALASAEADKREASDAELAREAEALADSWRLARLDHAMSLTVEKRHLMGELSGLIKAHVEALPFADRVGGTKAMSKRMRYEALETCAPTLVPCALCTLRAKLANVRERIATLYAEPLTSEALRTGGKLYRSAAYHGYEIRRGADYSDVVQDAVVLALADIRNGKAEPFEGTDLPTVGHVMGKLKWAWRTEVDAYRRQVREGLVRVHSVEELAELESIDSSVEMLERFGTGYAASLSGRSIWDDIADADFTDASDAAADVAHARKSLARARRSSNVGLSTMLRLERDVAAMETRQRELMLSVARERSATETREVRLQRVAVAAEAVMPTPERARVTRALAVAGKLASGWTIDAIASALGLASDVLVAEVKQYAAPALVAA